MIDSCSGYNQVVVHEHDKEKTVFTTPRGTFMYDKMPFGLMNRGATFQREMFISFVGDNDKGIVVYLDDMIFFSQSDADHLNRLRETFKKCIKFVLSLNPKMSMFAIQKGRLLRKIVSSKGICIYPIRDPKN